MILTTQEEVPGKASMRLLGVVTGNSVRAKHIGRDIGAAFKQLVGGELKGYTELMNEAREQAQARMIEKAESMGANAIVGVRFTSSDILGAAAEVLVYGTAVQV